MSRSKVCSLLLDPKTYDPDTLDLNQDDEARDYWIDCLLQLAKKFAMRAARSQHNDPTAKGRAQQYVYFFVELELILCEKYLKNHSVL